MYKPKYIAKGINEKKEAKKMNKEKSINKLKSMLRRYKVIIRDNIEEKISIIKTTNCLMNLGAESIKVLIFIKY